MKELKDELIEWEEELIDWNNIAKYLEDRLGAYLNTMVSDLNIDNKGQYLRDLFFTYEKELASYCRKIACEQRAKTLNAVCESLRLEEKDVPEMYEKHSYIKGYYHCLNKIEKVKNG